MVKGSIFSGYVTLANTLLGVSVVGSAYGFAQAGYALGTLLFVVCACFGAMGLHLLACCARTVGVFPSSFYVVAHAAAPRWTFLIDLAVAIKCFGVGTSYLIVIGDNMPSAIATLLGDSAPDFLLSRHWWVTLSVALVAPLAWQKALGALRFTALAALSFVLFLTVMVLLFAVDPPGSSFDPCGAGASPCRGDVIPVASSVRGVMRVLSIFVFAYTCHQNIFPICNEMGGIRGATPRRIGACIGLAVGTALMVHLTLSYGAYLTYGSYVASDLLENYPRGSRTTALARVAVSLLVATGYPLQAVPSRRSLLTMVQSLQLARSSRKSGSNGRGLVLGGGDHEGESDDEEKVTGDDDGRALMSDSVVVKGTISPDSASQSLYASVTAIYLLLSYVIAMSVTDLGIVLEVVGATGSTIISYVLPGFVYMRLHPVWSPMRVAAAIQLGLGLVIMPICLFAIADRAGESPQLEQNREQLLQML
jgi:amino acid permease